MNSNLDEYNYLYYYGEYITDNQIKMVDFFNEQSFELIDSLARSTIDAFLRGLKNNRIDVNKKSYATLIYDIGLEKYVRRIIELLDGKLNIIPRVNINAFNKQVDYNHRYDYNLYLTDEYVDNYLNIFKKKSENTDFTGFAGPIVCELFGQTRFNPSNGYEVFDKDIEIKVFVRYEIS